jgi:caa(3)-type oxidase subunit IV
MNAPSAGRASDAFARAARAIALAWLALLLLMLTSLGSAYLRLGPGNFAAGIAIAATKTAIVVWSFMQLRRAPPLTRIVAGVGVALVLLLMALSGLDYATRRAPSAPWQEPRQLAPVFDPGVAARPVGR